MNWTNLPFNNSQIYVTARLHGGCDIFVPVINSSKLAVDKAKQELHNFRDAQNYYMAHPPQGGPQTA